MSSRSCEWSLKKWGIGALWLTPFLYLCVQYLDVPLARLVHARLYGNSEWARHTSDLPDLLFPVVAVTTAVSLLCYLVRKARGVNDRVTLFFLVMTSAGPVAFLVKGGLKQLFGRVNTRVWLRDQDLYDFHWLNGGSGFEGFPSGHMLVLVVLAVAFWRFYPALRPLFLFLIVLLAVALIATNYHFLSDVIAGTYLALGVEGALFRILAASQRRSGG